MLMNTQNWTKTSLLFAILLISAGLTSCGCEEEQTAVHFLIDVTDEANYNNFLASYGEAVDEMADLVDPKAACQQVEVVLTPINDKNRNRSARTELETSTADDNPHTVKERYEAFQADIKAMFEKFVDDNPSFDANVTSTRLYGPLCDALNDLEDDSEGRKVMIIYSDMLENSEHLRIHQLDDAFEPEAVLQQLVDAYNCELPDMGDIELYVVNVSTTASNANMEKSDKFWGEVFEVLYEADDFEVDASLNL